MHIGVYDVVVLRALSVHMKHLAVQISRWNLFSTWGKAVFEWIVVFKHRVPLGGYFTVPAFHTVAVCGVAKILQRAQRGMVHTSSRVFLGCMFRVAYR